MDRSTYETLYKALKKMRLSGMAKSLESQYKSGKLESQSADVTLTDLIMAEDDLRHNKKLERLFKKSGLTKTGAVFNESMTKPGSGLSKAKLNQIKKMEWVNEATNILITGPAGTGKTYLANAIGVLAITQFKTVKYARPNLLLNELKNCDLQGTLPSKIQELLKADILIIDDFGMMKMDSDHCRVLFELLESREETLPTIFTSQLPVSRWYQLIEDSTYADACMDRILGNSIRIELKGESRRMNKKAKEEQKEDQDVKEA